MGGGVGVGAHGGWEDVYGDGTGGNIFFEGRHSCQGFALQRERENHPKPDLSNLDGLAIRNANRGDSHESIRANRFAEKPYYHDVRAIRASRLKPAIRNFKPRSVIRKKGVQFGNSETIRKNQAIADSRESGLLSYQLSPDQFRGSSGWVGLSSVVNCKIRNERRDTIFFGTNLAGRTFSPSHPHPCKKKSEDFLFKSRRLGCENKQRQSKFVVFVFRLSYHFPILPSLFLAWKKPGGCVVKNLHQNKK